MTLRGGGVRGRGGAIRLYGETESETLESPVPRREKNESRASARLETFAVFAYG